MRLVSRDVGGKGRERTRAKACLVSARLGTESAKTCRFEDIVIFEVTSNLQVGLEYCTRFPIRAHDGVYKFNTPSGTRLLDNELGNFHEFEVLLKTRKSSGTRTARRENLKVIISLARPLTGQEVRVFEIRASDAGSRQSVDTSFRISSSFPAQRLVRRSIVG